MFLAAGCGNPADTSSSEGSSLDESIEKTEVIETGNVNMPAKNSGFITISKQDMKLCVYDFESKLLEQFNIACGKGFGDKQKEGDMKTPEGVFCIQQVQDASTWSHDFKDGKGVIRGAYGSHFIRLKTPPHTGIGIHGTHDPSSIGNRVTEGCIRLENNDLLKLVNYVYSGMPVIITTSASDVKGGPAAMARTVDTQPAQEVKPAEKPEAKPTGNTSMKTHVVKSGDTLSQIAAKYGVSVDHLCKLNNIKRDTPLRLKQKLKIE